MAMEGKNHKQNRQMKPITWLLLKQIFPSQDLIFGFGHIRKAQKRPDADELYVEEIYVGEEHTRTVVSGLVKYIPLDEMQNRKVCVLCNQKPATMRGIESQAMVLVASNDHHNSKKFELVEPPDSAHIGERVTFPGCEGIPDRIFNPKKKVWETDSRSAHQ